MSMIDVSHLTFYYEGSYDMIFEDVSFRIDTDWKLGFIGRNGRGKTTFLRLLQGELEYRGSIHSPMKFTYFPYPVADSSRPTQEAVEAFCPGSEFWKLVRELNLLEVDPEVLFRPFDTLSNGEQTKVMLAALFSGEDRFLLIDEPTNHLDREGRLQVQTYLKKKKGFILVSHDRTFLDSCVDHVLVLNRQSIEVRQGNFSAWWVDKQNRDTFERAENDRLQREIGRMQTAARKSAAWADQAESLKIGTAGESNGRFIGTRAYLGEKSRRLQQRRKNLERRQKIAVEEKKELLHNVEKAEPLKLMPLRHHREVLVRLEGVSVAWAAQGGVGSPASFPPEASEAEKQQRVLERFSMELRTGERVSLQGRNGCGKSTVLKAVLAAAGYEAGSAAEEKGPMAEQGKKDLAGLAVTGGRIEMASGLVISYVPQDPSFLKGGLKEFIEKQGLEESLFKALLRKLDFSREQFDKDMGAFSAGQKKKVLLAKSLCQRAHLYLWDEPLNYVDVFSRMQIEELLLRFEPAMLFVEHDEAFVEKVSTRTIRL